MQIPQAIRTEFRQLGDSDDALANLRSIKVIRDWLNDAEFFWTEEALKSYSFRAIAEIQARPRQAVHRTVRNARGPGLTDPVFDGVSAGTLRYWLRWWEDPARSADGVEEAGRDPAVEAARVRAELEARWESGQLRRPV